MTPCPEPGDPWALPHLGGDFTRCDIADLANGASNFAVVTCVLVVLLLAILVFRGK